MPGNAGVNRDPHAVQWARENAQKHERCSSGKDTGEESTDGRQGTEHPWPENLLRLFKADTILLGGEEVFVLVLEYCESGSLFNLVVRGGGGGLSPEDVKDVFRGLIAGVQAMHARGLVHRDIKPHNILLARPYRGLQLVVKVADFGSCQKLPEASSGVGAFTVGTYPYLPPEAYGEEGTEIGTSQGDLFKADVWACGVTLYFLAHGDTPFAYTKTEGLEDLKRARYEINSDLPEGLQDLIRGMVALPSERLSVRGVLGHPWLLS
ncbi:unnamed protein product [Discosporangium mesarthrocarpum]